MPLRVESLMSTRRWVRDSLYVDEEWFDLQVEGTIAVATEGKGEDVIAALKYTARSYMWLAVIVSIVLGLMSFSLIVRFISLA